LPADPLREVHQRAILVSPRFSASKVMILPPRNAPRLSATLAVQLRSQRLVFSKERLACEMLAERLGIPYHERNRGPQGFFRP
jgi:hypothetical protein